MQLNGLHFLLTYQCTFACEHCFVWGSPWGRGTFTLASVQSALEQARAAGVGSVYFEGGEPFLYYPLLLAAVRSAHGMGFSTGIVSNAYWALSPADALNALRPFAGMLDDLSVSSDRYHYDEDLSRQARHAQAAAAELGIPLGLISIARPGERDDARGALMFRGRAIVNLAGQVPQADWAGFTECPHEDLRDPGRVHIDPHGDLHICQGIVIGNINQTPLSEICAQYDPDAHPVVGPLLRGGPRALVEEYDLPLRGAYADACHLCYSARLALRERFPAALRPDQMYGGNE